MPPTYRGIPPNGAFRHPTQGIEASGPSKEAKRRRRVARDGDAEWLEALAAGLSIPRKAEALGPRGLSRRYLGQARGKRDDAMRLLAQGVDPSAQARQDKLDRQALSTNTFELIAEDFLPSHRQAELFQRFREAERSGNAMDLQNLDNDTVLAFLDTRLRAQNVSGAGTRKSVNH